jgi:hypothetical protein
MDVAEVAAALSTPWEEAPEPPVIVWKVRAPPEVMVLAIITATLSDPVEAPPLQLSKIIGPPPVVVLRVGLGPAITTPR